MSGERTTFHQPSQKSVRSILQRFLKPENLVLDLHVLYREYFRESDTTPLSLIAVKPYGGQGPSGLSECCLK